MSDRTVATDALATLGTIIDENQKRDAIHLAVEPVIAAEPLVPGQHVGIVEGKATAMTTKLLGIVDPFVRGGVNTGERFWLVIYPRVITSLRHVWSHPDMTDEPGISAPSKDKKASEEWLRNFIAGSDCPGYEEVIGAAVGGGSASWDSEYLHFDGQDAHGDIPPEFWDHVEIVTGRKIPGDSRAKYFSCSC